MSTKPNTLEPVSPALLVLATCLERVSSDYHQHLDHEDAFALLPELGESLRHLATCYTRALCASLGVASDEDLALDAEEDSDPEWGDAADGDVFE